MPKLVVTIPVGPSTSLAYLRDTVESVRYYAGPHEVILVDDSGEGLAQPLREDGITVLSGPGRSGNLGRFYETVSSAWQYALQHHEFDVLLADGYRCAVDQGTP